MWISVSLQLTLSTLLIVLLVLPFLKFKNPMARHGNGIHLPRRWVFAWQQTQLITISIPMVWSLYCSFMPWYMCVYNVQCTWILIYEGTFWKRYSRISTKKHPDYIFMNCLVQRFSFFIPWLSLKLFPQCNLKVSKYTSIQICQLFPNFSSSHMRFATFCRQEINL